MQSLKSEKVKHPSHYGGADNKYEAIKIIDAWSLSFSLGNAIKYLLRSEYKGERLEDLKKAAWYLDHEINNEAAPSYARRAQCKEGGEYEPLKVVEAWKLNFFVGSTVHSMLNALGHSGRTAGLKEALKFLNLEITRRETEKAEMERLHAEAHPKEVPRTAGGIAEKHGGVFTPPPPAPKAQLQTEFLGAEVIREAVNTGRPVVEVSAKKGAGQ